MAGTDPDLWPDGSGDEFKTDIRAVQQMAMPNIEAKRPTFYFDQADQYAFADSDDQPYDWTDDPVDTTPHTPVQVLCTVDPQAPGGLVATEVGTFAGDRLFLTFFAEEWAQVIGFRKVTIDDIDYAPIRRFPTSAIFDVDQITVEVRALDAS